jgi:hypothetical protein
MKQWITLLAATALFASCSKQDLQEESTQQDNATRTTATRTSAEGAYVSGWGQTNQWQKSDQGDASIFTTQKRLPEVDASVLDGGLVLTYAKANSSDPRYASLQEPRLMPFFFLPEAERVSGYYYYFSDQASFGSVSITFRIALTTELNPEIGGGVRLNDVQYQHVVLTKSFLESRGLTASTVRNYYTYSQVMDLANPL